LSRQVKINNECTYRNSKTNSSLLSRSSWNLNVQTMLLVVIKK
jgi:hypothetical protein